MQFYEYFEWLCKVAGVTVPEAYNGAGINKGTVSRWRSSCEMKRDVVPSISPVRGISSFFNLPVDCIFSMKWRDGIKAEEWQRRGRVFREMRKSSEVSIEKMSTDTGISQDEISAFESFGKPIDYIDLYFLCDALGANVDEICLPPSQFDKKKITDALQLLRDEERVLLGVTKGMTTEQIKIMTDFARQMKGNGNK